MIDYNILVGRHGLNAGATDNELENAADNIFIPNNSDYIRFLQFSNGCILENGVSVYPLADLAERNGTFEVNEYAPGYILVGDDSGGTGFLLATDPEDKRVYTSGLGDLNPPDFKVAGNSFGDWISSIFALGAR